MISQLIILKFINIFVLNYSQMSSISPNNLEPFLDKEKDKEDSINNLTLEQLFENEDLLKSMSSSNNYQTFSQ